MEITRYRALREELIQLYNVLTYQYFYMFFPRSALLSLEELENTEYRNTTGTYDRTALSRPELQKVTIETLIDVIPNVQDFKMIGYRNPKDAITIYESVQRYLTLWCDVITELPEFAVPPIKKLYQLESVAEWAFTQYKIEILMREEAEGKVGDIDSTFPLISLLGGLTTSLNYKKGDLSFVSHLDSRLPSGFQSFKPNNLDTLMSWGDPKYTNF